jgi:hypothetical protein
MSNHTLFNEKVSLSCRYSGEESNVPKESSLAHDLYDDRRSSNGSGAIVKSDSSVLIVDWDGPDDPSNPKKQVFPVGSRHAHGGEMPLLLLTKR